MAIPLTPDVPFMISPAGYLVTPNWSSSPAPGGNAFSVRPLLPGGSLQVTGTGEFDLTTQVSGRQGCMRVTMTTGAQGSTTVVALLSGNNPATTKSIIGIVLDNLNRPFIVIIDPLGTTIAQSLPPSPPLVSGTALTLRLSWSSSSPVSGADFAFFEINDLVIPVWATEVTAPWTSFTPTALFVGSGGAALSYSGATGTITSVQISNTPAVTLEPSTVTLTGQEATLSASATLAGTMKAAWHARAAITGVSSVSATHS